jgi:hypothetical protein
VAVGLGKETKLQISMTLEEIITERNRVESEVQKLITDFNIKLENEKVFIKEIHIIQGHHHTTKHISINLGVK